MNPPPKSPFASFGVINDTDLTIQSLMYGSFRRQIGIFGAEEWKKLFLFVV